MSGNTERTNLCHCEAEGRGNLWQTEHALERLPRRCAPRNDRLTRSHAPAWECRPLERDVFCLEHEGT